MPLFRVEGGRSVAVLPLSPARERFDVEVPALLTEHLDVLLGEPLLLVREGRTPDEPSLLAVDGAGQPVVVEVVAVLDDAALLAALRSAGRAGRLGPQGLARVYRGGAEQYAAHLAAVRGAGPGSPARVGSRLVLVVAEVAGVEEALDHLRQDGRVEVLQVGVLPGPDQDRWIDVSPLGRVSTRASEAAAGPRVATVTAELPLDPPQDAPAPAPVADPVPAAPPVDTPAQTTALPVVDAGGYRLATALPRHDVPAPGSTDPPLGGAEPLITPPPPGVPSTPLPRRASALHRAGVAQPAPILLPHGRRHDGVLPHNGVLPHDATPAHDGAPARERLVVVPVAADAARPVGQRPPPDLPYAFTGRLPDQAYRPGPDDRLVRLAGALGSATVLIWHRGRRGASYEALLHPDGMIELTDGTRVSDPSAASEMASGSQVAVDGWQAWRLESSSGPTLADACAAALSPSRTPTSIG